MIKTMIKGLCASWLIVSTLVACSFPVMRGIETTASIRGQEGKQVFKSERTLPAGTKLDLSTSLDAKIILSDEAKIVVMSSTEERLTDLAIKTEGDVIHLHDELIKQLQEKLVQLDSKQPIECLAIDIYIPSLSWLEASGKCYIQMPKALQTQNLQINLSGASKLIDLNVLAETLNLDLSGASEIQSDSLQVKRLALDCSGASQVKMKGVFDTILLDLSGASEGFLEGRCQTMTIDMSGASSLRARELKIDKATIELSGASDAELSVMDIINYDISGSSDLTTWGSPRVGQAITSGASSFQTKQADKQTKE